jgi:hypothetical protein
VFGFALQSGASGGRVNDFTAIESGETASEFLVEFRQLGGADGVVLLQNPQGFPDDLACRVVPGRISNLVVTNLSSSGVSERRS